MLVEDSELADVAAVSAGNNADIGSVEKVVGWAFSYHLMSCSEPTIRDNKLIISVESRYELSNQMEVGLDSFQRQVAKRFIDLNSGEARLLQAHKPWNWRSRRQSKTRKELVTSTAAKPWTHQLVSSILRSLPRFFFNSPLSIGRQTVFRHRGGIEIELYIKIGMGGSDVNDVKTLYYNVLGNGLTPSAADVAVYADLHSSVPGLGKVKTAMMLRRRFLGKLPKPATPARDVEVKRAMEDDGGLRSLRLVHEVLFALLLTRTSIPLMAVADDSIEVNFGD
ncbi:hypothetical protein Bca4012_071950 [Brassica carinata]|uniref:DUF7751 domain-containing protein n=1 Tax=Brassica carinata TaxID=52824 RepID=A0A8X7UA32_BRACI|nr:hypothetical protein Bca52824_064376 [Brassica carinata]